MYNRTTVAATQQATCCVFSTDGRIYHSRGITTLNPRNKRFMLLHVGHSRGSIACHILYLDGVGLSALNEVAGTLCGQLLPPKFFLEWDRNRTKTNCFGNIASICWLHVRRFPAWASLLVGARCVAKTIHRISVLCPSPTASKKE